MIPEIRTCTLVPDGAREYLRLYDERGREIQTRVPGHLVARRLPETGDVNQRVFIWAYANLDERRERLMADAGFAAFRKAVRALLVRQDSRLLTVV